ncbi:hypothetical protein GKKCFE_10650 [Pseudomonas sp. E141]
MKEVGVTPRRFNSYVANVSLSLTMVRISPCSITSSVMSSGTPNITVAALQVAGDSSCGTDARNAESLESYLEVSPR